MRVEVRNLKKHFGKTKAVDDISFNFSSGDIVGFVGPNGAGKTTTMRILSALEDPTEGEILLDGHSIIEYPEKAMVTVGYMPDSLPNQNDITVNEFLDFFARAFGLDNKARKNAIEETESFTKLTKLRNKTLKQLSKGMKQRVSLARAIIHDPDILILDEPAAGLDPRARVELLDMLKELASRGKAILVSSHILSELGEICDNILIIEKGKLLYSGQIDHIMSSNIVTTKKIQISHIDCKEKILKILETTGKIENIEAGSINIKAEYSGDDTDIANLLESLIDGGCRITEFRIIGRTLSDIFMDITKGEVS
ncbi:MAG: ABC transporter ATP-binding protein [Sedimentisphaeraceae bacterium JB056]